MFILHSILFIVIGFNVGINLFGEEVNSSALLGWVTALMLNISVIIQIKTLQIKDNIIEILKGRLGES